MPQTTLVGTSAATETLRREIAQAARTAATVMVLGETGVGKEVVARSIHEQGARSARPFVAINCSGIPDTLLESELFGHVRGSFTGAYRDKPGLIRLAHGGTLFLDELGEMSLRMQAMLLRFTETGEVHTVGAGAQSARYDVRLITATNRDLLARMNEGAFRQDLYFRLNVVQIRVAALRDRPDDIPDLLDHYLPLASQAHGTAMPELTTDALRALRSYRWPGNVRELRNVVERLAVSERLGPITMADLPIELRDNAAPTHTPSPAGEAMLEPFSHGGDFWTLVYQPFKSRELTREDLISLIDAGLRRSKGSYRTLLSVFNLPQEDYKRFHAFLYQQQCNLPPAQYRTSRRRRGVGLARNKD